MYILRVAGIAVGAILIMVFSWWAYMGGFSNPSVEQKNFPATEIVYTTHIGPYEKIGLTWAKFNEALAQAGLKNCAGIGIYLDPPDLPKENLRSVIGCRIDSLSDYQKATLRAAFPAFSVPAAEGISAKFPYKNQISFAVAPVKVYPVLQDHIEQNSIKGGAAIEIYDEDWIEFFIPHSLSEDSFDALKSQFRS